MTLSETASWRDAGAAHREAMRVASAQRSAATSRDRFEQRVADAQAAVAATPPASTQRLLDIRI
jgi:hypothetical protein